MVQPFHNAFDQEEMMSTFSKSSLKSLFLVTLVALFAIGLMAAQSDKQVYQERFARTVPLAKEGSVSLSNIAGDIQVDTWNQPQVQIQAMKISRASTLELAQQNAQLVQIEVETVGNEVQIETKYPKSNNRNLNVSVEYVLMVPDRAAASINSVSGSIRATGLGGKVRLHTVSGSVDGQRLQGPTEAKSVSGEVSVVDTLDSVICKSVSGSVRASNVGGETEAKSVSGDVTVEMSRGSIEAEAMSGDVQIAEAGGAGFDLRASTFSGRIKSDFPLKWEDSDDQKSISSSVNGGGKTIRAKSFSGNVRITKQ